MIALLILASMFQFKTVSLAWDPPAASVPCTVVGYNVYRATVSNGYAIPLNTMLIMGTTYTDTQAPATQTVYYVVRQMCDQTESPNSNEVSVNESQMITNPGSICYNFNVGPPTNGVPFGYLFWDAVTGATSYSITWQDITQPGTTPNNATTNVAQYQFNTTVGHTYKWSVVTTVNGVSTAPTTTQFTCYNVGQPKLRIQLQ